MLTGEEPTEAATNVMDVALVLHAEHGSNASTFVARATASTLTDVYSAITAATGALKGPPHGAANEAVMEALQEIGSVEGVDAHVQGGLARPGGRAMGFGLRVCRVLDPGAQVVRGVSRRLSEEWGDSKGSETRLATERVMGRATEMRGKQARPTVGFFGASVYHVVGFPADLYTPIFAVARL